MQAARHVAGDRCLGQNIYGANVQNMEQAMHACARVAASTPH
jgi:hypothetical protein